MVIFINKTKNMKEILEKLESSLFKLGGYLNQMEMIYQENQEGLEDGSAVRTEIALQKHKEISELIEKRKEIYYNIETEISKIKEELQIE